MGGAELAEEVNAGLSFELVRKLISETCLELIDGQESILIDVNRFNYFPNFTPGNDVFIY